MARPGFCFHFRSQSWSSHTRPPSSFVWADDRYAFSVSVRVCVSRCPPSCTLSLCDRTQSLFCRLCLFTHIFAFGLLLILTLSSHSIDRPTDPYNHPNHPDQPARPHTLVITGKKMSRHLRNDFTFLSPWLVLCLLWPRRKIWNCFVFKRFLVAVRMLDGARLVRFLPLFVGLLAPLLPADEESRCLFGTAHSHKWRIICRMSCAQEQNDDRLFLLSLFRSHLKTTECRLSQTINLWNDPLCPSLLSPPFICWYKFTWSPHTHTHTHTHITLPDYLQLFGCVYTRKVLNACRLSCLHLSRLLLQSMQDRGREEGRATFRIRSDFEWKLTENTRFNLICNRLSNDCRYDCVRDAWAADGQAVSECFK